MHTFIYAILIVFALRLHLTAPPLSWLHPLLTIAILSSLVFLSSVFTNFTWSRIQLPLSLTELPSKIISLISFSSFAGSLLHTVSTSRVCFSPLKVLHNQDPLYLFELLHIYTPSRTLRSFSAIQLNTPSARLNAMWSRAFSRSAPFSHKTFAILTLSLLSNPVSKHTFSNWDIWSDSDFCG